MRLSELIRQRRDALLARWTQQLTAPPGPPGPAPGAPREEVLSLILEELSVFLETGGADSGEWVHLARLAGGRPTPEGDGVDEPTLMHMCIELHESILAEAQEAGLPASWEEMRLLARGLHAGVWAAVEHLARVREREQRRQTAELETILESLPDGVYVGNLEGVWRTNRRGRELLGLASPEPLRQPMGEVNSLLQTRWEDGRPVRVEEAPFARALRGEYAEGVLRMRHMGTGQELVLRAAAAPLRDNGEVRGAVGILSDITAQVEATQAREQEHALLRQMLESLSDAFVSLSPDWRLTFANEAAARLVDRPRQALLGLSLWEVLPGLRGSPLEAELHRARREGQPRELCHRYGRERWFNISLLPFPSGLSVLVHDVTERLRREQEREQQLRREKAQRAAAELAVQELQRGEALQEQVTGIVGHDLRTPLSAISLTAQQLLRQEGVPPTVRQRLQRISASTERMARMVGELLDFTRTRLAGGLPIERRPVDVCAVVRRVVEELEVGFPGRLSPDCSGPPLWGLLDAERLAQVVSNLVGNALQHGAPDTPVRVEVRREGEWAVLSVHNQGPPIPPGLLPHLFDPFRRGGSGDSGGLGLGLYIASQVVQAHGGTIDVTSTAQEGTCFRVRLPLEPRPVTH